MKFGYRDRIILLIVLVVIIFGIGIFVFIKPKWEKMNENQKTLETAQNNWDTRLLEFDRIPAKQENINKKYEKSLKIVDEFTDEMTSVELDEFLRKQFVNTENFIENEVQLVDSLAVTNEVTSSLGYYYMTPSIVTYPLYEYADLDGSLAAKNLELLKESGILSARAAQTVGAGNAAFSVSIGREDLYTLLDAVYNYAQKNHDAMMINKVSIVDWDFNYAELDEDGNLVEKDEDKDKNNIKEIKSETRPNYTKVTIEYSVFYMQEPMKPDVGPKYDKAIWDGDGWRTAAAE